MIFGILVEGRFEWYRPREFLQNFVAAPPCLSSEKTTGAVAPASVIARVLDDVEPCVRLLGRVIGEDSFD